MCNSGFYPPPYCVIKSPLQLNISFINNGEIRLFSIENGRSAMRCAVFCHERGRHCREVPRVSTMKTVVMATKTVVAAMKTVVMPAKGQISFGIFRPASTFVCYRRFSGSLVFPQCQDFLLSGNKETLFFHFLPSSFYRLLVNPDLKERNVKHE